MILENKLLQNTILTKENSQKSSISIIVTRILISLFLVNLFFLFIYFSNSPNWKLGDFFRINRFTLLIGTTVTFFGAVVAKYASNYLTGFKYHSRFMLLCLGFTLSVMFLVMSNHIFLFSFFWLLMGIIMSQLIGIDKDWGEAKQASKFTLSYFATGTFFLVVGLLIPAYSTGEFTIDGFAASIPKMSYSVKLISALFIILSAIVQSAIYPFHKWLLSAMTAPTPASALMHAGFVNGSGILLALFSSLIFASNTLNILFIIGGLTAIIAQFTKLLQVNVKQKLACSTIAQMGFMIMQCGLGFFNAAVAHLILHGFYKAYLFLSSGEEIAQIKNEKSHYLFIKPLQAILVLLFGCLGAYLFATWTGKGLQLNSSIFLILIVAITVGQVTYNIVKEKSLPFFQKIVVPPVLFIVGIGTYALLYNGVTLLMKDLQMVNEPVPLTWVQISFGILFLLGFFIMKLGVYKKYPWVYVKLMNASQPYKKSVLMYKSN